MKVIVCLVVCLFVLLCTSQFHLIRALEKNSEQVIQSLVDGLSAGLIDPSRLLSVLSNKDNLAALAVAFQQALSNIDNDKKD